ncbi:hypothetical protein E2C01_098894 [Portunus trituberculatus]|uniref:Uncharacterized protein n=1 Tax=Portunus trituberculatus TaxID=210409 RepID=A0A5B7K8W0_PORTR|nr:hypothetical protein [Portunus trituberculatus]
MSLPNIFRILRIRVSGARQVGGASGIRVSSRAATVTRAQHHLERRKPSISSIRSHHLLLPLTPHKNVYFRNVPVNVTAM